MTSKFESVLQSTCTFSFLAAPEDTKPKQEWNSEFEKQLYIRTWKKKKSRSLKEVNLIWQDAAVKEIKPKHQKNLPRILLSFIYLIRVGEEELKSLFTFRLNKKLTHYKQIKWQILDKHSRQQRPTLALQY